MLTVLPLKFLKALSIPGNSCMSRSVLVAVSLVATCSCSARLPRFWSGISNSVGNCSCSFSSALNDQSRSGTSPSINKIFFIVLTPPNLFCKILFARNIPLHLFVRETQFLPLGFTALLLDFSTVKEISIHKFNISGINI